MLLEPIIYNYIISWFKYWVSLFFILITIKLAGQPLLTEIQQFNFSNINIVPSDKLDSNKLMFLSGEYHGLASNRIVEYSFISNLVLLQNVRTILFEGSISDEYLINNYIEKNDTAYLNLFLSEYPYNFYEEKEFWIRIHNLNSTLPDENKIYFRSIDIYENDDTKYVKKLFYLAIKNEVANDSLSNKLNRYINDTTINYTLILQLFKQFQMEIDYNKTIIDLINSFSFWERNKANLNKNRHFYLYQNILKRKDLYYGNIYANFGYGHIDIGQKSTAYYLKNDTSFKHKIIVFYPYYYNCTNLPWIPIKKSMGYNKMYLKRIVKKSKVENGVYFHERKGKNYIIHVGQKGMHELE
ncbi:MAG: hypothetical protein IT246_09580 [Bacteroidia bacterium]|nr:hypothetical protein [Bacteroidia bacterium]